MLEVRDLKVSVGATHVLDGVRLHVAPGEVVAVMGPNGSGKSTLVSTIMGKPGYQVEAGAVLLDGQTLNELPTDARARLGLALISQSQPELPGVQVSELATYLTQARSLSTDGLEGRITSEAAAMALDPSLLERWVNVDLSGGERKKMETLLARLVPARVVIGDEIDSGLDIDALVAVASALRRHQAETGCGLLLITHYPRLLKEIPADRVLVLVKGRIVAEGTQELALQLEQTGYAPFGVEEAEALR